MKWFKKVIEAAKLKKNENNALEPDEIGWYNPASYGYSHIDEQWDHDDDN